MPSVSRRLVTLGAGLLLMTGQAFAEGASRRSEGASPWHQGFHSKARLVSGGAGLAGVEIVLDAGFKTYWRQPGDAGLPPRFDWAGSENLAGAEIAWPAPARSDDAGGVAYSYHDRVLFPVRVKAQDPARPVRLRLKAEYGVCKEICIPASAELTLLLDRDAQHRPLIEAALARVPRPQPAGAPGPLSILSMEAVPADKPTYRVSVRAPDGAALFAEGPENWYLSSSVVQSGSALVTVEEKPKGEATAPLRITLVAGQDAVETELHLDGTPRSR